MCDSSALFEQINLDLDPILTSFHASYLDRVRASALKTSLLKKFEDTSEAADKAAIQKFLEVNERMKEFSFEDTNWESPNNQLTAMVQYDLWKVLNDASVLDMENIMDGIRPGPGASVGVSGGSLFEKLATGVMSHTRSSLYSHYLWWARSIPHLHGAELKRTELYGAAKRVDHSSLSCVPKNREISRTICTEPLLNMMYQQGVGAALNAVLKRQFGIDLATQQDKNKRLARIGSIDGRFATVDLSSASDSISLTLCERILPKEFLTLLKWCRTDRTKLPNGDLVELHMISSMGNGFTFPLQTLIFATLVRCVYRMLGIPVLYPRGSSAGNFCVNGDDIIVVAEAVPMLYGALEYFGFQVNNEKSYVTGYFRESCGGDFLYGDYVRGVYARKLDSVQDIYSLINRLNDWSDRNGIALRHTVKFLVQSIRSKDLRVVYVPYDEMDTAGIKVPLRYAAPKRVVSRETGAVVFTYSAFKPRKVEISVPAEDPRWTNALWSSILYGGCSQPPVRELLKGPRPGRGTRDLVIISVRPMGPISYDLVRKFSPRWDYCDLTTTTNWCGGLPWGRKLTVANLDLG